MPVTVYILSNTGHVCVRMSHIIQQIYDLYFSFERKKIYSMSGLLCKISAKSINF